MADQRLLKTIAAEAAKSPQGWASGDAVKAAYGAGFEAAFIGLINAG